MNCTDAFEKYLLRSGSICSGVKMNAGRTWSWVRRASMRAVLSWRRKSLWNKNNAVVIFSTLFVIR